MHLVKISPLQVEKLKGEIEKKALIVPVFEGFFKEKVKKNLIPFYTVYVDFSLKLLPLKPFHIPKTDNGREELHNFVKEIFSQYGVIFEASVFYPLLKKQKAKCYPVCILPILLRSTYHYFELNLIKQKELIAQSFKETKDIKLKLVLSRYAKILSALHSYKPIKLKKWEMEYVINNLLKS
jgi:hypothetical protein